MIKDKLKSYGIDVGIYLDIMAFYKDNKILCFYMNSNRTIYINSVSFIEFEILALIYQLISEEFVKLF